MAGLIQNAMSPQEPETGESQQHEAAEPPQREMQENATGEDPGEGAGEDDPNYQAGLKIAMDALYKQGGAKDVAKAVQGSRDPAGALAEVTYSIIAVADERTEGKIPDELLVSFGVDVLTEVAEIAEAAGVQVSADVIGQATQKMLVRFLQENGMDTSEIEQAMAQINQTGEGGQMLEQFANQGA